MACACARSCSDAAAQFSGTLTAAQARMHTSAPLHAGCGHCQHVQRQLCQAHPPRSAPARHPQGRHRGLLSRAHGSWQHARGGQEDQVQALFLWHDALHACYLWHACRRACHGGDLGCWKASHQAQTHPRRRRSGSRQVVLVEGSFGGPITSASQQCLGECWGGARCAWGKSGR